MSGTYEDLTTFIQSKIDDGTYVSAIIAELHMPQSNGVVKAFVSDGNGGVNVVHELLTLQNGEYSRTVLNGFVPV